MLYSTEVFIAEIYPINLLAGVQADRATGFMMVRINPTQLIAPIQALSAEGSSL
jgi:hypothetical protein